MIEWKSISPEHLYLKEYELAEGKPWQGSYLHRLYQPTKKDWPIYDLHVRIHKYGISICVSVKWAIDGTWDTCCTWEPIPFELSLELINMIAKGAER